MKKMTSKTIKKELIKIINRQQIDEVIYEPRYMDDYQLKKPVLIGSTITIRTTYKKIRN